MLLFGPFAAKENIILGPKKFTSGGDCKAPFYANCLLGSLAGVTGCQEGNDRQLPEFSVGIFVGLPECNSGGVGSAVGGST